MPSKAVLLFITFIALLAFAAPFQNASAREMADLPVVKLQSLDKITARTQTFEANVGSTVKFGPLFIKVQACRKASPVEQPESSAFLQISEITEDDQAEWVFSGWMFASSPGLSHMDHPIYDVWVLDCLEKKEVAAAEIKDDNEDLREGEGEIASEDAPAQPEINDDFVAPTGDTVSDAPNAQTPSQSDLREEEKPENTGLNIQVPQRSQGYDAPGQTDNLNGIEVETLE